MSRSSSLGSVLYNLETTWGEDVDTFGSRMAVIGRIDVSSLVHEQIERNVVQDRKQGGVRRALGTFGGDIKTSFHLCGHGATTLGAVTLQDMTNMLGRVFGTAVVSAASGTTATGGTATAPTTTASGTFASGALTRIGALGDGRGGGQIYAINNHTTTTLTLLTALGGSPSNGDVVASGATIHSNESPTAVATLPSYRFLFQTANKHYSCHGCFPKSVSISALNAGELPTIEITWGVSRWKNVSTTFPSATANPTALPAPNSAGSCWYNSVGTATNALKAIRSFSIDYTLGIQQIDAINGAIQYQKTVSAVRVPDNIKVSLVVDAEDVSASPAEEVAFLAQTEKHALITLNPTDGKAVGFYFPNLIYAGNRPTQQDMDGLNRVTLEFTAHSAQSGTTDLERSAFRMYMG